MKKFLLCLLITYALVGCSAPEHKDFFVKSEKMDEENFEYIGDITVNKEGYYFLWCIPFASAKEDAAKELMIQKTKWGFPGCAGVFEFKTESKEEVAFFDWAPNIQIKAKVVKKRGGESK